ncbi:ATP-binding cassette domain-containing protein [Paenibacillus sp. P25]|nr:ATP-binding cassette domain-containing protein [Paenibacillus sp. P25]
MKPLLEISHLQTAFQTDQGEVVSIDDVSFRLNPGETIGIVGESGRGKSVTSLSIMKLLSQRGRIRQGSILFGGEDLVQAGEDRMRAIRGNEISMIFQEPMTSLNPVFTIGHQLIEAIRLHMKMSKSDARAYAVEMLKKVGIPRAEAVIDEYPHSLSGGMRRLGYDRDGAFLQTQSRLSPTSRLRRST